jgi:hypothetical protein
MIANHFFNLPNEDAIYKAVLNEKLKAVGDMDTGANYLEANVEKSYRNIKYNNFFSGEIKQRVMELPKAI